MRKITVAILAACLLLCSASIFAQKSSGEQSKKSSPDEVYAGLLGKLKAGDPLVDYQQLRISWADSKAREEAKDTSAEAKAMFAELRAEHYEKALASAMTVIGQEYINADAHFVAYAALKELHRDLESQFQLTVFHGLVKSILDSGDGKKMETAWLVVDTDEEYLVLRVLGLKVGSQSLRGKDGHSYDELDVHDPKSGNDLKLFFNIDISMRHMGI
jgi:hypothetical protein